LHPTPGLRIAQPRLLFAPPRGNRSPLDAARGVCYLIGAGVWLPCAREDDRMVTDLSMDRRTLAEFCRRHHIRRLALFGSVLRPDFRPDSDVDVLVEFEPGHKAGLIRMAGIENELSDLFGRKVDLRTPSELSRYFRQEILSEAEVLYAQG